MFKLRVVLFVVAIVLVCSLVTSAHQTSSVVDVPMMSRGVMPAVEVMVNGKGPFVFAIDTGASGKARADSSLVERLGLQKVGEARGGDGSGQNMQAMGVVQLDSISIGALEFHNVQAPSRNYNTRPGMEHIDGILGFDLFADHLLTLDYPRKRVRIENGQLPSAGDKGVMNFEISHGIPIIEISVGDTKIKAHIDSGNMVGGFILPTSLAEKLDFVSPPVTVGRAHTVSSDIEIKEGQIKGSIHLGGHEFMQPTITYPAVSDVANVGSKILREFAITFDQKNKRVRFNWTEPKKAKP